MQHRSVDVVMLVGCILHLCSFDWNATWKCLFSRSFFVGDLVAKHTNKPPPSSETFVVKLLMYLAIHSKSLIWRTIYVMARSKDTTHKPIVTTIHLDWSTNASVKYSPLNGKLATTRRGWQMQLLVFQNHKKSCPAAVHYLNYFPISQPCDLPSIV